MERHHVKALLMVMISVMGIGSLYASENMFSQEQRTRFHQKNGFVVSEPRVFSDERDLTGNDPEIQTLSRTSFRGGLVYDSTGNVLDTNDDKYMYVISHTGVLYTGQFPGGHHSYFMKSKPGKFGYGIGKDVARAGDITIVQGKIVFINNNSGHYQPVEDQLKLVVQMLHKEGVLDPNVKITVVMPEHQGSGEKSVSLEEMLHEQNDAILSQYQNAEKRTNTYIEERRGKEEEARVNLEALGAVCPQSILGKPFHELFPNFKTPVKGKNELGDVTVEGRPWKALLVNTWDELPPSTFGSLEHFVRTWPIISNIQGGVETSHAACLYQAPYAGKFLQLYLIPAWPKP